MEVVGKIYDKDETKLKINEMRMNLEIVYMSESNGELFNHSINLPHDHYNWNKKSLGKIHSRS